MTSIGNYAFYSCSRLASVSIPAGVTSIGDYAFSYCSSLASVSIPAGVTSIGDYAFYYCDSLASVSIPAGVTSIGPLAFHGCSSLASVTIPASVTSIGIGAIDYCNNLTSINVSEGNNVYSSLNGVLFNKTRTELVTYPGGMGGSYQIPDSVTSIGAGAFRRCSSLASVTIPEGVKRIGGSAFWGCSSLASVTIPASVTSIERSPFDGCSKLTSINVSESNNVYSSLNGVLFNKTRTELVTCPGGMGGSYQIPDSVTSIGKGAFYGCSSLASVTIPAGVTSIEWGAFKGCSSLASVIIPASVTSIGEYAFFGCSSLASVTIPAGATSIGGGVFYNCSSLASVTIPASVTSIGCAAFSGCDSIEDVFYEGTNEQWELISIDEDNDYLTSATIHYNAALTITVTYDANSGTGAPEPQEKIRGEALTLSSVVPTRVGYVFIGWADFSKDLPVYYQPGDSYLDDSDVYLYAQWGIYFAIHYENLLDTDLNPNPVYQNGMSEIVLEAPCRDGYIFSGWYSDPLFKTKVTRIPQGIYEDTAVYAKWTPITYSVVLNSNSGSGTMGVLTGKKYDMDYELPANKFTRKGYSFVEWNTRKDGSGSTLADGASFANLCSENGEKVTLYAQWEANQYVIHFEANGGIGYMDNQVFSYDSLQSLTPNAFTKEGYQFAGWKLGKTTYTDGQSVKNLTALPNGEVTLSAQWKADKAHSGYSYVVSFDGNGSTKGSMKPQTLNVGTTKALTANSFSKTGYNFVGWSLDPNGEAVYSNKAKVKDLNIEYGSNAITLYAVWQPNSYTVTFNGNGGKYLPGGSTKGATTYTQTQTYDEYGVLEGCRFERAGYEFAGWARTASAKAAIYADGVDGVFNLTAASNGKVSLYAVWTPIAYSVTYTLDGGVNAASNPDEYNAVQSVSLKAATKPGYTFAGWYDDLTGKKVTSIAKGSSGDKAYTAHWKINTYNVKYNANGGKGTARTVKGLRYGEEQLVVETNWFDFPGYSFAGWNTKANGTGTVYLPGAAVDIDTKNGSTVNLYAMWEYTVDLNANGGEGNDGSITLLYNHSELLPSDFVLEGFVFVGWNTDQAKANAGTAQYKSTAAVRNIGPDKTLYAAWKPIGYTVKFNGNGSTSGSMSTQTATYDISLTLKANSFKRTGYTFVGWALTSDGDVEFANGEQVLNLTTTNKGTVTLYAKWQKN